MASDMVSKENQAILGRISNINMIAAGDTLSMVVNQKVDVDTPTVDVLNITGLKDIYKGQVVGIKVSYNGDLICSSVLILTEKNVKIIADLMMGGTGDVTEPVELNEIDMSAIGEAMNQMVGSAATSLANMLKQKIDITTPQPFTMDFDSDKVLAEYGFEADECIVMVKFNMGIGSLVKSEVVQLFQKHTALEIVNKLEKSLK